MDIATHRWSRTCAVASAALAPVLLATTCTSHSPAATSSRHHNSDRRAPRVHHHGRRLAPPRAPAPRAVASRGVPDERALGVHPGARAGGDRTAVSACYAGPLFNTVVGLGLSLTLAAGAQYPAPFTLPADSAVYETVGFLCAGLAWALVVVPARGMRLDRVYGVGFIVIYLAFFGVRVLDSLGLWFG
ncbi:hypothetical protein CFC21_060106 [Triticum aestivum]|uniref:Sodium/calcium exchanger membrane region domain-containing protein n=2 Tax=Triticum aestivum TaxID=4565 RepID=A0A3B6JDD7_WHEAT|nr:hypothetical protein CFC21_060106 [Triticum aestivum]